MYILLRSPASEYLLIDSCSLLAIRSIIVPLNLLDDLLHLLGLLLPLFSAHLGLSSEQLFIWFSVASAHPVPKRGELAVVVIEV